MNTSTKTFKKGERIITAGESASLAYRIVSGCVRVSLDQNGRSVTLAELGPESLFGETALLSGGVYGANVEAAQETVLQIISPETIREKIENSDPLLRTLIDMLIERLGKTNQALVRSETREFIDIGFI